MTIRRTLKRVVGVGLLTSVAYGSYLFFPLYTNNRSVSHTLKSAFYQWVTQEVLDKWGANAIRKLESSTINADKVQEELLLNLIRKNENTIYGREHRFSEINSKEDFFRLHPITNYEYYEKYVTKIVNGETNVLTEEPVILLAQASGISGQNNLIPVTQSLRRAFYTLAIPTLYHALCSQIPSMKSLQKSCKIMFEPAWEYTKGGIKIGPNSIVPSDVSPILLQSLYSSPDWLYTSKVTFSNDLLFLHALFALNDRNLGTIESDSISVVHNLFDLIDKDWSQFADLIEMGIVPPLADAVVQGYKFNVLKPDPQRAQEIRDAMKNEESTTSIIKRLWPHLNVIQVVDTYDFEYNGKQFRERYVPNGDIPILSPIYAAAEGLLGLNLSSFDEKSYVLLPQAMFFEFLPIQHSENDISTLQTLLPHQLKIENEYELVVTNLSGLYRYRIGDVVKFKGLRGQAPIIQVKYRRGMVMNKAGERTNEKANENKQL